MPTTHDLQIQALQGSDTLDLLDHIAWNEVVLPRMREAQQILTRRLVELTLTPPTTGSESREQVAGKIFGIDFAIRTIEGIVRQGRDAASILSQG